MNHTPSANVEQAALWNGPSGRALTDYVSRLGPVGLALREVDDATRVRVVETVRAAFEPFVHGDEVRFDAACWMIGARR